MRSFRPVRPQRSALPGLLVIVLIALGGVLLTRGVSELFPEEMFESSPWGELSVEDIEVDSASGLPIVPTTASDEVSTWTLQQPNSRIDAANTWSSGAPAGSYDPDLRPVTLMATYPTFEEAMNVAQGLAGAVGDPVAETIWLEAAGVEPGDGFEWVGPARTRTPFVQVVDRRVLVSGLDWREEQERWLSESDDSESDDEDPPYRPPLAQALERSASSVLVEDPFFERAVAFDLVCIGDADAMVTLGQDLADSSSGDGWRPVWMDPALTADEQRARRTWRLVHTLWAASLLDGVKRSGEVERLSRELTAASEREDFEAASRISAALVAHIDELVPAELPDLGPLADVVDQDAILSALAERSGANLPARDDPAQTHARAVPFGAADPAARGYEGSAHYDVFGEGRRLWLTLGSWFDIAQGLGPLVQFLDANGCDDIQVVFHDYDDVRAD